MSGVRRRARRQNSLRRSAATKGSTLQATRTEPVGVSAGLPFRTEGHVGVTQALPQTQLQPQQLPQQQLPQRVRVSKTERERGEEVDAETTVSTTLSNCSIPFGGRTKHFLHEWKKITKDPFILQCVQGCYINFSSPRFQTQAPRQIFFNKRESTALKAMLVELEADRVIQKCGYEAGDYLNSVFLREKRDSTEENPKFRIILNMKELNKQHVTRTKHKMNSLQTCLDLMTPSCYMASIDLKNAFHTIPMVKEHCKYLKFKVGNQYYQYKVLPMGFKDSPRLFCKILKPALSILRKQGHISSVYIDDFFLAGANPTTCSNNVVSSVHTLTTLGFDISNKSSLNPSQELPHLGFILNSINMTVSLDQPKIQKIYNGSVISQSYRHAGSMLSRGRLWQTLL